MKRESDKAVQAALKAEADKKADAEQTEAQREKARADAAEVKAQEAESRAQAVMVRNAITLAVADPKLQARDPEAIALLVDREALEVEGEEVTGIDAELKRIKTKHPALFYSTTADGGARGGTTTEIGAGLPRLMHAYANSKPRR